MNNLLTILTVKTNLSQKRKELFQTNPKIIIIVKMENKVQIFANLENRNLKIDGSLLRSSQAAHVELEISFWG